MLIPFRSPSQGAASGSISPGIVTPRPVSRYQFRASIVQNAGAIATMKSQPRLRRHPSIPPHALSSRWLPPPRQRARFNPPPRRRHRQHRRRQSPRSLPPRRRLSCCRRRRQRSSRSKQRPSKRAPPVEAPPVVAPAPIPVPKPGIAEVAQQTQDEPADTPIGDWQRATRERFGSSDAARRCAAMFSRPRPTPRATPS